MLGRLGIPLVIVDIDVEERLDGYVAADSVAEVLARHKAEGYKGTIGKHQVLVTADTVVVLGGRVLGKPHSREEAVAMLGSLSGRSHQVYTGVCLRDSNALHSFTERTDVHFKALTDEEIAYYVDTYRPYDKAGAYGIQEWIGMVGIERIEGCYYNVMGLPVARLYKELSAFAL